MESLARGGTRQLLPGNSSSSHGSSSTLRSSVPCKPNAAARGPCHRPRRRLRPRPRPPPPAAVPGTASPDASWGDECNGDPQQHQQQQQQHRQAQQKQNPSLLGWLPGRESRALLVGCWQLLRANLAAVLIIHAAKEAAVFLLHRMTQRLTNAVAEGALGVVLPPFASQWYLFLDPRFVEQNWPYQIVVAVFFLASLPVNILFNAAASSAAALVCTGRHRPAEGAPGGGGGEAGGGGSVNAIASSSGGSSGSSSSGRGGGGGGAGTLASPQRTLGELPPAPPKGLPGAASFAGSAASSPGRVGAAAFSAAAPSAARDTPGQSRRPLAAAAAAPPQRGLVGKLRAGAAEARLGWAASAPSLRRVWYSDLAFNAWSLPLQAASLLVLPVFWAFPRLLAIQLAVPSAALAGTGPAASLAASRRLMAGGAAAAYAWPYLLLTLAARGADAAKQALLLSVPERWWREIMEVPIAITLGFTVAKVLVARMQDLLPLATYLRLASQAGRGGGATGGGGGEAFAGREAGAAA